MKSRIAEIRLTLYSLISSIETDLRNVIRYELIPHFKDLSFIKDENVKDKLISRYEKENPDLDAVSNLKDIIEYLDFQESYKLILENKDKLPTSISRQVRKFVPKLDEISSIRNRVMHSRPLLSGDFTTVYSFVCDLIPEKRINWESCEKTLLKLEKDPSFVFSLKIPEDPFEESHVYHNLPMADFDESGFIGRESDSEQVKKLLLGNNRVVSIIGDGGIGKSALILKVAYDIVDLKEECPFDAIIWVSAKTAMLSTSGIQYIHNSIRDYTGFIERITENVGAPIGKLSANIKEILEFFNEFNVLLIIDNLETILEKDIRYFIREAQQRCKIAITSRVGLGELEFPRKLSGLTEEESTRLVREISTVRNSEVLRRLSNSQLSKIANQLLFNPLAIKWFVNSVDSGRSPKEVLNNKDDLLNYCLSNVYEKLSENAKLILSTLLSARKPLNDAELNFLTCLSPLDMRKALNRLFVTTLARREVPASSEISECVYSVSDFTKNYLLAQHPPKKKFVQTIASKIKKLSTSFEEVSRVSRVNEFNFKALEVRTQNEKVICRYLVEALKLSRPKMKRYDDAIIKVNEAREIVPNYFEVYRVSAFIKSYKGDLLGAEEDYKIAIEMEPENVRLLYFYAGFLLYQMDDVSAALPYAKKAYELRPSSPETVGLFGRCIGYLGNYEKAIGLLEKVLEAGSIESVKSKKIITTIIINFYRRWAKSIVELNQDYKLAIEKLKCSISIFEKADNSSESDYNMVKEFCELIMWLLRYCADFENKDEKNAASNIYKKYEIYIDQTPYSRECRELYQNKYLTCQIVWDVKRYTGVVIRFQSNRTFGFLSSNAHGELYFNRNSFIDKKDWINLRDGVKLEYSLGENPQGECATDIIIYQIENMN